ncbi:MAG: hypothetical protein UX39_C0031G0007 [Candidatus Magasanikbacteria bacterium GW2011_GWA2_46_17]|uniref:DUF1554 domain-containing protein n=1 Tax=Candidatus Magasanikbacteria bacterium GW2011_GWA2_46_17 TaxID=1619042 RepID=A0A0G1NYE9_9BACT|nr:MAG: hypothetical protein UX39_C0031G0007 [Candidatus Magasanikbacteria bacterium GW2011_GWA2_46_17]
MLCRKTFFTIVIVIVIVIVISFSSKVSAQNQDAQRIFLGNNTSSPYITNNAGNGILFYSQGGQNFLWQSLSSPLGYDAMALGTTTGIPVDYKYTLRVYGQIESPRLHAKGIHLDMQGGVDADPDGGGPQTRPNIFKITNNANDSTPAQGGAAIFHGDAGAWGQGNLIFAGIDSATGAINPKMAVNTVNGRVGIGTTNPQITLAIGDDDTGLKWNSDGNFSLYTNNNERVKIDSAGDVSINNRLCLGGVCLSAWPVEADPQVGALVNGKWCTNDGTQINCNVDPAPNYWTLLGNDIYNNNIDEVGIGTNAPAAKLTVDKTGTNKTGSAGDAAAFFANSANSALYLEQGNAAGFGLNALAVQNKFDGSVDIAGTGGNVLTKQSTAGIDCYDNSRLYWDAVNSTWQCTKPPAPLCAFPHHYFITIAGYNGNLGGRAGADAKCNSDLGAMTGRSYHAALDTIDNGWGISGQTYFNSLYGAGVPNSINYLVNSVPDFWSASASDGSCNNFTSSSGAVRATDARLNNTKKIGNTYDNTDTSCGASWMKILCVEDSCVPTSVSPKHYFITTSAYNGNLKGASVDGQTGANLKCNNDIGRDVIKTYRAALDTVDNGWGVAGQTYSNFTYGAGVPNSINYLVGSSPYYFWSAASMYGNCNSFTSASAGEASRASLITTKKIGTASNNTNSGCGNSQSILCVEE